MKKSTVFVLGTFILAGSIGATEYTPLLSDPLEKEAAWFKNPVCIQKFNGGGSHEYVDNGRSGTCLKVVTNDKQVFMYNTRGVFPVKNGAAVRVTFWAKGKGNVSIVPMGRTAEKKVIYFPEQGEKIDAGEWKQITFSVVLKDPKGAAVQGLTLRLNVKQNSSLLIDDFKLESKAVAE